MKQIVSGRSHVQLVFKIIGISQSCFDGVILVSLQVKVKKLFRTQ